MAWGAISAIVIATKETKTELGIRIAKKYSLPTHRWFRGQHAGTKTKEAIQRMTMVEQVSA